MSYKSLLWIAVLIALLALIFIIVAIITIRATWDNPDKREFGALWLYLAGAAVFIAALMIAIATEMTPDLCQLPYSGEIIPVEMISS